MSCKCFYSGMHVQICALHSAFSLQPAAFSLQPSAFSLQPSAFSLQPSALMDQSSVSNNFVNIYVRYSDFVIIIDYFFFQMYFLHLSNFRLNAFYLNPADHDSEEAEKQTATVIATFTFTRM